MPGFWPIPICIHMLNMHMRHMFSAHVFSTSLSPKIRLLVITRMMSQGFHQIPSPSLPSMILHGDCLSGYKWWYQWGNGGDINGKWWGIKQKSPMFQIFLAASPWKNCSQCNETVITLQYSTSFITIIRYVICRLLLYINYNSPYPSISQQNNEVKLLGNLAFGDHSYHSLIR